MSTSSTEAVPVNGLIDLLSEAMGGRALWTSDDFFASMENLVKPGRGVFRPGEFTDRGKWMDGWESGRTRSHSALADRDECILRLGAPGRLCAVDVDTNHFLGNHPPYASLEALRAPADTPVETLRGADWIPVLPPSALRPGSQNLFVLAPFEAFSHVRLTIFPDGGVARLRVYGEVDPTVPWPRERDEETLRHVPDEAADLAGALQGGRVLGCSDMFFGPMHNLVMPGRAATMGEGWETRRRRGPGHDWILVALGRPGLLHTIEVDTNHFKGNFPEACLITGIHSPGALVTDLVRDAAPFVTVLPRTALEGHTRHFFHDELAARGPFTHLLLHVSPDGGVSRLRAYGTPQV